VSLIQGRDRILEEGRVSILEPRLVRLLGVCRDMLYGGWTGISRPSGRDASWRMFTRTHDDQSIPCNHNLCDNGGSELQFSIENIQNQVQFCAYLTLPTSFRQAYNINSADRHLHDNSDHTTFIFNLNLRDI